MNQIFTINPSFADGVLAFTDQSRGLFREPFVAGSDMIISAAAIKAGHNLEHGFPLHFSLSEFPGATVAVGAEAESGGKWYLVDGFQGWLCPALLKYFDAAPDKIWFQIPERTV